MTTPPRLSVGYNEQGILLYRTDENNQPVMVALMDCTAAIRYAADLATCSEHLIRAVEDYVTHAHLIDAVEAAIAEQSTKPDDDESTLGG